MNGFSLRNLSKKEKVALSVGAGAILLIVIISIAITFYQGYLYRLETVAIKNYPSALPGDMKGNLEIQLRRLLTLNFDAPDNEIIDAKIRDGAYTIDEGDIMTASFLVDIDKYEQTYSVIMNWSDTIEISDGILIACPSRNLMKYPEANCIAMYDDSQDIENVTDAPIYDSLPIIVDEFDFAARRSIHYEIRGYFNDENKLVIVINDYSGDNYENGLNKIKELGYNLEDYKIEYVNQAGNF